MVTPIKLFMKTKGISYDDKSFDKHGGPIVHHTAFQKCFMLWLPLNKVNTFFNKGGLYMSLDVVLQKGLEWHDLLTIASIQSYDFGKQNEVTRLYPFMQAATVYGVHSCLETIYHLAMYDTKLIY
mmetsp:Transcript_27984/g.32629  ORF Transcript_27984/g.32629 Transcript_27984/m.32629 type:complete len:125 (+) Transcript_27984:3-377(+)